MKVQDYRPVTLRPLNSPKPTPEPPAPEHEGGLDRATIMNIGSSAGNGVTATAAAAIGAALPHTSVWTAVAAGALGACTGLIVGGYANYKALDIADRKNPSRNMYGLVALGMGVMGSTATGLISGLAGYYGANPLLAGGVATSATAVGNYVLYQR